MIDAELLGTSSAPVRHAIRGDVGWLMLNRPDAINALDRGAVTILRAVLNDWLSGDRIAGIVLCGNGTRGFCAGGDIRGLYDATTNDRHEEFAAFLATQYQLDLALADAAIPVVSLLDGVVLGGGVGVGAHASLRVVTERTAIGMPEARIGFVTDATGSYLLSRMPGRMGEYLAATSRTINAADAIYTGLADVMVPVDRLDELRDLLLDSSAESLTDIVLSMTVDPGPSSLATEHAWIDRCFAYRDSAEIISTLLSVDTNETREAAAEMARNCAVSMDVSILALRAARDGSVEDALRRELAIARVLLHSDDLQEGVRTQIIDKQRNPRWRQRGDDDPLRRAALQAATASIADLPHLADRDMYSKELR